MFFQGYAEIVPNPSAQDLPYRTVKTILYHVTNTMGTEVKITYIVAKFKYCYMTLYMYRMVGNSCGVLIFVIFVFDSALTKSFSNEH